MLVTNQEVQTVRLISKVTRYTLDIFPSRLHPRDGRETADLAGALVAAAIGRKGEFDVNAVRTIGIRGCDHPFGRMDPGCVMATSGEIGACDQAVVVADGRVTLPDGEIFDAATFSPRKLTDAIGGRRTRLVQAIGQAVESDPVLQVAMGALSGLLPQPYDSFTDSGIGIVGAAVAARAPRSLRVSRRSGRVALEFAWRDAETVIEDCLSAWILGPDRGWAPRQLVASPDFEAILTRCDPDLLAAGARAGSAIAGTRPILLGCEMALDRFEAPTAHAAIAIQRWTSAVDQALLEETPDAWLKPSIRKKRNPTGVAPAKRGEA